MPKRDLQWLLDRLIPVMEGTRSRRLYIEMEWLENYQAWQGWPSQRYLQQTSDGGIRYFIPSLRRAIERNVTRGTKLLMPNMDWHQTLPFDGRSHQNAEAVHSVMRYIYQKKIPTKHNISSLLRCINLYNFGGYHTSVVIQRNEVWPYQRTFDPFSFYVFPETASTIDEALLLFEDTIIPYQVYMSFVNEENPNLSIYEPLQANELHKPEWPYHLIQRLAYRGLTAPDDYTVGKTSNQQLTDEQLQERFDQTRDTLNSQSTKAFVALSKVYFRMGSKWYYTVIARNLSGGGDSKYNAKIVRLDETENQPLYRWTTTRPLPGELYTNSQADDIRTLQNISNTALSQIEANRSAFAEPPLLADATVVGRMESKLLGNRKLWLTEGAPKDMFMQLDVQDGFSKGLTAYQVYLGLIDKGSGGTLAEGQPGRNMPRAGFAANRLLDVALVDVEDISDTVEQEVLTPGLSDVYHVMLESIPDKQLIKIPNKNPNLIKAYKRKDLYGDYSFSWIGSLGFQDTELRANKFTQLFQVLFNPNILQLLLQQLAQQGMTIDIVGLLNTYYSYGIGERGLGDLIIPMTPQQQQAMNQPSPEQQMDMQQQQMEMQHDAQMNQQKLGLEQFKAQAEVQKTQGQMALEKVKQESKVIDIKAKMQDTQNKYILAMAGVSSNGSQNSRNSSNE